MKKNQPHLVRTESIYVEGNDPRQRGMARASQIAPHIRSTVRAYSELYSSLGISESDATAAARTSMDAIRDWDPDQHLELLGVASPAAPCLPKRGTGNHSWCATGTSTA